MSAILASEVRAEKPALPIKLIPSLCAGSNINTKTLITREDVTVSCCLFKSQRQSCQGCLVSRMHQSNSSVNAYRCALENSTYTEITCAL